MPPVVDTALAVGAGTGSVAMLLTHDVARVAARIIARPRFEVTVPGCVGILHRILGLLPQRLRDQILGKIVPNQVASVDLKVCSDYEEIFPPGQPPTSWPLRTRSECTVE
jgi:hypothetical protein